MATDTNKLRDLVLNSYLNPPANVAAAVIKQEGNDNLIQLQKRMAGLFADAAVLTVKEIEANTDPKALLMALVNLSVIKHLIASLSPSAEFFEKKVDMPEKAN